MSEQGPHKHGVVAVLDDGEGRLLYIKRGPTLKRAPGYWCLVGGEVEAGESWEAATKRETMEEVGLDVEVLGNVHESISPNGEFRLHWMRATLSRPGQVLRLHAVEVAEALWLRPKEALRLEPMLPTLRTWLAAMPESGETR
jgi:8-oxo-dGTP pyrophosphatase MutT (NUDIX family)